MKILLIHNKYGKYSGEETVVDGQIKLLKKQGHEVITYFRDSAEIDEMRNGKIKAFFTAFKNPRSIKEIKKIIQKENPEIVHIHNLFPLISPAILPVIKQAEIPIVMSVHNYRLVCPNGLFFTKGGICEKCSNGKEWNCIVNNCENSIFKSIGYALRNWYARIKGYYLDNVDLFACLNNFQKSKLIDNGFSKEKILVIPNMTELLQSSIKTVINEEGSFIGFVGRVSDEKGFNVLINAAREIPDIPIKIAGEIREGVSFNGIPKNVSFTGYLEKTQVRKFMKEMKALVFPSICYETFGLSMIEAMSEKTPIIASKLGGISEIVEDEFNGLLFESGNASDMADKIKQIWNNARLVKELGENGYEKMIKKYSPEVYYKNLISMYEKVLF